MSECKITVVIPNYNGDKFLEKCLDSLYEQESGTPDYEVLVVDNGSTDHSLEILSRYPALRLIALPENTGFCHAVNVGIENSTREYVILLNNDTWVKPGFVKGLYEAIKEDSRIFSVSSLMLMWDRPELVDDAGDVYTVLGWALSRGKGKPAEKYGKACSVFSACGGAAIYRRSVFDEIGLFDEQHFAYLEDLDIGYRARIYGYRNMYTPDSRVVHFGSASTGSRYNAVKTQLAAANSVYVPGKNMPILQLLLNLPFLLAGYLVKYLFFCKKKMGRQYLKGLKKGLQRLLNAEGRSRRVPFKMKNLGNYFRIQVALYINLLKK